MIIYYDSNGDGTENATLSNVVSFPTITQRLNKVSTCVVKVVDRLGALYGTWKDYDYRKILIKDQAAGTIMFRGYLVKIAYEHNEMTLTCRGIGAYLEWKTFRKNYRLAEGLVKTVPYAGVDVTLTDIVRPNNDDGNTWTFPFAPSSIHDVTDNVVIQPATNYDDSAYAVAGDGGESQTLEMTSLSVTSVQTVTVWILGNRTATCAQDGTVDININGWQGAQQTDLVEAVEWHSFEFDVADKTEAHLDALQIKLTASSDLEAAELWRIYIVYAEIEYEHSSAGAIELQLDLEEDTDLDWTPNQWVDGSDNAIFIKDTSNILEYKDWTTQVVCTQTGGESCINVAAVHTQTKNAFPHTCDEINGQQLIFYANLDSNGAQDIDTAVNTINTIRIQGTLYWNSDDTGYNYLVAYIYDQDGAEWIKKTVRTFSLWENYFQIDWSFFDADIGRFFVMNGDDAEGIDIKIEIYGQALTLNFGIDEIHARVYYATKAISPIVEQIDGNGDEWVYCEGITWADLSVQATDSFDIGENVGVILGDLSTAADIGILQISQYTKYMARWIRGDYCIQVLNAVCKLEGWDWYEDYENDQVVIGHIDDFDDSAVDLTNSNYQYTWKYDDNYDYYSKIELYGSAVYSIYYSKEDDTITSPKTKSIIDDTIMSTADAKEIVDEEWAKHSTKKPSLVLTLEGINADLKLGTTVGITMVNPTVGEDDYIIRRIDRSKYADTGIITTIYAGEGQSPPDEAFANKLDRVIEMSRKALTDKLVSSEAGTGSNVVTWGDVGGADAGAVAAVLADDAYIKNDANDETTGDLTVANLITAGLVDGVDVSAIVVGDTKEVSHAYVEATALTMENDITFNAGQTFDGEDVSALAVDLALQGTKFESLQWVEDTGLDITKGKTINFDVVTVDPQFSGICMNISTVGCNNYDAVYIDGADSVAPADADDFTKMPVIGIVVMANRVLIQGTVKDDDLIKCTTVGDVIYMSTTLREVTADDTAPAGAGNIVQVVGICVDDHTLYLNPSLDWVEVA